MKGNLSRWVLAESGWRMQALLLSVNSEVAVARSLEERNLIVWYPEDQSNLACFYYGGAEMFPSEVLKLEELEREIIQLRAQSWQQAGMHTPIRVEQVAAEALVEQAIKTRDAFLERIVAQGRGTSSCP